ncbi:MAG: methyltransferase domain-containing protein [Acidobacteriota bacterium]
MEGGRIQPCRTIDLGCGTGANVIYLAQHGFDVTGAACVEAVIKKARARTRHAGARMFIKSLTGPLCEWRAELNQ